MAAVAIGAAVLGSVISARSQVEEGKAVKAAADTNALELEEAARLDVIKAEGTAEEKKEEGRRIIGRGLSITGASGVKAGTGSAKRSREVDQQKINESVSNILFSGQSSAKALKSQAASQRVQGASAKKAGKTRAFGSLLGGASAVAGISQNQSLLNKL